VLVAGATGFVGRRLCAALADAGHDVAAMTRNPAVYHGAGTPVYGDVRAPVTLHAPMAGCQVAYYLAHSLSDPKFRRKMPPPRQPSARRRRGPGCSASSTWEDSATTPTPCRPTCAAAARWKGSSERLACP
jgi:uncharacterized protein YbjT (DUF2867 family)